MSWFVFGKSYKKSAKNLETPDEKIAYNILNNAFKDADAAGITPVLATILEKTDNDNVKNILPISIIKNNDFL
jgi:hypothetical protein